MGTILQERVPQQCLERVSITEREWKRKASWSNNRPNVVSNKMGRRQPQRRSLQQQYMFPSQENSSDKKLQQRRKQKSNTPSTKRNTSLHSAQVTSDSKSHPLAPAGHRMEPKVQSSGQHCSRREQKNTGFRGSRHTPAFPCHRLTDSGDLLERPSSNREVWSMRRHQEGNSDTDLSESETLPVSPSGRVPPQLELRPEVIVVEDHSTCSHRPRGRNHGGFDFPDFLPPPFNSWSLSQLAVFYNMEGRGAPRPRPVGPLERYLDRLLQLEWRQIQTFQEESGKSAVSDVPSSCHRSPTAASSRLSSPKCILQCQRAFPLTFLSSLASHSALLSGCACTLCRIRYSTCSTSCCRSTHSHARQSRLSPMLERRGPTSLPKRSYSESRVHSSDRSSASQVQRFSSPVRTNSHLRRMQASGNIRNPAQGANMKTHSTARDSSVGAGRDRLGSGKDVLVYRTDGYRKRSGSEQRRARVERQHGASDKRRSGSECRRGGAERRRTSELKEWEIKPDAVTAIMDNLPGSKNSPTNRPSRVKQVEFVT
ncbi:serine/arginine repetitive matrix protein 2-like [Chaetodon trifascialis]|uniref:serine/arginine repetitive matrix protein 2-like n=1 Tax=Chaetodon trifascialis TaxID=109706 RepID=UPI0039930240